MTYEEIKSFLAIVDFGTISAAAEKLYVTQSGLSRRIRSLESELGYPLFARGRGSRAVDLTSQGKLFFPIALNFLQCFTDSENVSYQSSNNFLTIAANYDILFNMLSKLLKNFYERFPHCKLTYYDIRSSQAYLKTANKQFAISLISSKRYSDTLKVAPIYSEPMLLVTSSTSKYGEKIHPAQLDPTKELFIFRSEGFKFWHSHWFNGVQNFNPEFYDTNTISGFLQIEGSWTILPYTIAKEVLKGGGFTTHDLTDPPPNRTVYCLTRPEPLSEVAEYFLDCFSQHIKTLDGITPYI